MIEIERKYLVHKSLLPEIGSLESHRIEQGYLQRDADCTIRVRISNDVAFLTIKGKSKSISRKEFEYEIPKEHAKELMKLCGDNVISKSRYIFPFEGKTWELDVFYEKLEGLILAEIELKSENETFLSPSWLGSEVSLDSTFYNSNLSILSAEKAALLVSKTY